LRIQDNCGDTYLSFSFRETDDAKKTAVAAALWSLFLSEPDKLADFEERIYYGEQQSSHGPHWATYRVRRGRLTIEIETDDEHEDSDDDDEDDDE